jgi:hypothetical protein
MAKICRSLSGPDKFIEVANTCKEHESEEHEGCLDAQGVLTVLEEVVPSFTSTGDKVRGALL